MSPKGGPRDCPCHSGLRYRLCCEPLHQGKVAAESPEALMRSRYAAFALGLGAYLVDTLAAHHPDRTRERAVLIRELAAAHVTQRFMGLRIYLSSIGGPSGEDPRRGEVLFYARIFERGRDHSFVELSEFVREQEQSDNGWQYVEGLLVPAKVFGDELAALTRATFLARVPGAPR